MCTEKICKRCGLPIKVNNQKSDIFEDMHWLCFHLEFEHGDYDPDEPCDDPSCPWNIILGNDILITYSHSDIKIISSNKKAAIFFSKRELELYRLPSVETEVVVFDEYFKPYKRNVWFEEEHLQVFIKQIKNIWETGKGEAALKAMSEEDFSLRIMNIDSLGHIVVLYKVKDYKYIGARRVDVTFENGFEIDFSFLEILMNSITKILNIFK